MSRNLKAIVIGMSFISMFFVGLFPYYVVAQTPAGTWPDPDWTVRTPKSQDMNSSVIEEMYDFIYDNQSDFQSVMIVRNGYIIDENFLYYFQRSSSEIFKSQILDAYNQIRDDTKHAIWSCTKSVTSLLIGIAIEEGFIDNVDQTFFEIFPDKWKPSYGNETKKTISIEHLLTMTSGLNWSEPDDGFEDWPADGYTLDYILDKPLVHEPGTTFEYSTGHTELLSAIIQKRTGMKTSEFARQYLFEPIGIQASEWEWTEDAWQWGSGALTTISHGGFGIYMNPRAMARIGLLALNNGTWDDTQVVPEEWIDISSTSHVTEGLFAPGTEYGYLWWLSPEYYSASGLFGQRIIVIPEHDIVVVLTHEATADILLPEIDVIVTNYIIKAVLPPSTSKPAIPGYNLFLVMGIISVVAILITKKQRIQSNK
ncbi:hypothetical protein LCGC14_0684760 [marine sediment metagenome]|uniref:Beta-lactamase-related domain-containing protein n=1 Tax=marine sediment metagenome TaxID=412755 RepID=A0A0F9QS50_9ZZZZ